MAESPDTVRVEVPDLMLEFEVTATMSGRKTSEGDGRTAADIEREMREAEEAGREWH